jgi:hypothetical protein
MSVSGPSYQEGQFAGEEAVPVEVAATEPPHDSHGHSRKA